MTRKDYIMHLDALRKGLLELMEFDTNTTNRLGKLTNPEPLEEDRAKKTAKMFEDLSVRLYEDGAVSERIQQEKLMRGDVEQSEITFPEVEHTSGKKKGGAK